MGGTLRMMLAFAVLIAAGYGLYFLWTGTLPPHTLTQPRHRSTIMPGHPRHVISGPPLHAIFDKNNVDLGIICRRASLRHTLRTSTGRGFR